MCAKLPSQVVGELVGIPEEDWPQIHAWSERNSGGQDPEFSSRLQRGRVERDDRDGDVRDRARRTNGAPSPRDDLTTLMLAMELDGEPMTDIQFGSFFVQLVTAGNDTTRTMLSSGLLALLDHPDQLAELRADRSLIPGAVEEILRWANPLHYFRRTATRDTELGGVEIAEGQKVAMIYTSANRDDDGVPRSAPLRHPPRPEPAPLVRHRRALLPGRAPGPARRAGVLRGAFAVRHRADRRPRSARTSTTR